MQIQRDRKNEYRLPEVVKRDKDSEFSFVHIEFEARVKHPS